MKNVLRLVMVLVLAGCDKGTTSQDVPLIKTAQSLDQPGAPEPKTSAANDADRSATKERNFNGAIFQVPVNWVEVPNNSGFVIAEFQVSGLGGHARLTLSTARGSVEDNIRRWKDQFFSSENDPAPKETPMLIDGKQSTLVELFGTFRDSSRQSVGPQPDSALLGAVIQLNQTNFFVKLTGPRDTISEVRETFVKFIETAKFNE